MKTALLGCLTCFLVLSGMSQETRLDSGLLDDLTYRLVGPSRGGRVTAVAGDRTDMHTFYMGATGGGVWRTSDAGNTWQNISDDHFKVGSIGAIAVAPSDANVIYVGTGSTGIRGNVSIGKGVYKSTDKGESWEVIGLEDAGQIGKIEVHPENPDLVFVAALGNPFGANSTRGIYRSKDGGSSWVQVLFVSDRTGAVDLAMDPNNPRILYAAMWTVERKPWTLIDGSEESGIWKSTDGGESWNRVKGGLPEGLAGKAGVAISPANSQRIWVIQEAAEEEKGGLYRSDDGGKTWNRINREHKLRQRAWYYNHVIAHPTDEHTVFVLNVGMHKSIDGGETFQRIYTPHGDNHALWINSDHPQIMVEGNDGGACVTLNDGKTWSSLFNQPTAEFYRVAVDEQFPYRLYGAQQDNTTISVPSKPLNHLDPIQDWYAVGGGESGHIAVDPRNPDLIYAGTYIGQIDRKDRHADHTRDVVAYPQMHDGTAGRDIKYRFQWNAPLRLSPHNPDILYHCSQYVHRSGDGGNSWEVISPDLTTNNDEYQNIPGGPIQHDHTGVELYTTIFAFEESPHQEGELWAGSDDGLLHLSRDGGLTWTNITPSGLPKEGTINAIELSRHAPGRAFVAVYKYRENDFSPYIFMTEDHGANWKLLTKDNGIPADCFVRVVREDPHRQGLLYAGTEFGMFISLDGGSSWQSFQQNLPITPITDLQVKDRDLVVATQGRSFWILDDLTPLHHWPASDSDKFQLFPIDTAYRSQLRNYRNADRTSKAPLGALIHYYLPEALDSNQTLRIEIRDPEGQVRRIYANDKQEDANISIIKPQKGLNRLEWNLRYEAPETVDDAVFSLASTAGIKALPGPHTVVVTLDSSRQVQPLEVAIDPRWSQSSSDLSAQYQLTYKAMALLNRTHDGIKDLRLIRDQLQSLIKREDISNETKMIAQMKVLSDSINNLEDQLIQTKSESRQDPINYPSRIDDQIAYLYSVLNAQDARPNEGAYQRLNDLQQAMQPLFQRLVRVREMADTINNALLNKSIPIIQTINRESKP